MNDDPNAGVVALAQADAALARLSGLLLSVLIERGLLNQTQAELLVREAAKGIPANHTHRPLFDELIAEFRE